MARYPVRQPDGQLAVWSTIVDRFIAFDCTIEEAVNQIDRLLGEPEQDGTRERCRDVLLTGRPPYDWCQEWDTLVGSMLSYLGEDDGLVKDALRRTPDTRIARLTAKLFKAERQLGDLAFWWDKAQKMIEEYRQLDNDLCSSAAENKLDELYDWLHQTIPD